MAEEMMFPALRLDFTLAPSKPQSNRLITNEGATQSFPLSAPDGNAASQSSSATSIGPDSPTYGYSSLKSAMYGSGIVNPMDWLTAQDRQLVQQETGLTIENGRTYDSSGNETYTQSSSDLINALYQIHQQQATNGATGAVHSIGAPDIANYIQFYAEHAGEGAQQLDTSVLTRAMQDLGAKEPNT